jgi:hypothetical protein
VSWRLLPRDYTLALLLDDHRVLTTGQITAVLFGSARTCRNRLTVLRRLGFLDRFTLPHRPGGQALECWLPGLLAARYAALARDQRPPSAAAVRDRQDAVLASPQLAHLLGVNQFFIDLLAHTRTHPHTRLARWWPAAQATAAAGRRIRPDGHGVFVDHEQTVAFWLEHDTGSEFSGGRRLCRQSNFCVCAGQRLVTGRYRLQQVWCKDLPGVPPAGVGWWLVGWVPTVYEGRTVEMSTVVGGCRSGLGVGAGVGVGVGVCLRVETDPRTDCRLGRSRSTAGVRPVWLIPRKTLRGSPVWG